MPLMAANSLLAQEDSSAVQSAKNGLQEVVVSGLKANQIMPITQTTIGTKQIAERYYGADVPTLIRFTPSINMQSDNGTGMGYSSFRLRGMDQTRINTTINGIPINDAENQGVYFNNFADLASSAESIQIQRGIGTSTNGTSAFGGSINILTRNLSDKAGANVNVGYGSFNSQRATVELQSGLLHNRFMFYGRYGQLSTDGYRTNSGSTIRSYAFSAGYKMQNAILKINMFGGFTQNQLSYSGIDKTTLDADRKFNPFVNGERDAFMQNFYQLQYIKTINTKHTFSSSAYYVNGSAPQFQFLSPGTWGFNYDYFNMPNAIVGNDTLNTSGDMMTSYRLSQNFYGAFANYNYKTTKLDLVTGLHANQFNSTHFMEINWGSIMPAGVMQNHEVYNNTGVKSEVSAFTKATYSISNKWNLFGDAQLRAANFSYSEKQMAIRNWGYKVDDMNWKFFNWRFGGRFTINTKNSLYAMAGVSHREPTRFDYFQDDFATRDIKQDDIKPEDVLDVEIGYQHTSDRIIAKVNLYNMQFNNQIIGLGQLNTFGYNITTNVKSSQRMGLELELSYKISKNIVLYNNSSFSNNQIKEINQHLSTSYGVSDTVISYKNVAAALSPNIIINQAIKANITKWFEFDIMYRYVGLQYLDNTGDKNIAAPAFNFIDAKATLILNKWIKTGMPTLSLRVNNMLNQKYVTTGSVALGTNSVSETGARGAVALFMPSASVNYFVTLGWKF